MSTPSQKETKESWLLRGLLNFSTWTDWFQLAVWMIFLAVFPPLAFLRGLWFASIFLSGLGLWATWMVFGGEAKGTLRARLCVLLYIEHSALVGMSLWMLLQPIKGGWQLVKAPFFTGQTVQVFAPRPTQLVAWTGSGKRYSLQTRAPERGWRPFSRRPITFTGWVMAYDAYRDWTWFGLHDDDRINFFDHKKRRWKGLPCREGQARGLATWKDRLFVVVKGELGITDDKLDGWKTLRCGSHCSDVESLVDPRHPWVVAVGRRWLQSQDGGHRWRDITPKKVGIASPKVALGWGGWRYVYQGGMWSGELWVSPPGRPFVRRALPASDIRILITHPRKGSLIWMGTWGQGVYESRDGGKSWRDLGLQGVEIRSLALDPFGQTLYAGASNLVFRRGLYRRALSKLPHMTKAP